MGQSTAVRNLAMETTGAANLRAALAEHADDADLILTAIEGETNFNEAIAAVYEGVLEDEILLAGLKAKLEELTDRKTRFEKSIEDRRTIILQAMDRAGVDTVRSPLATFSRRATKPKLLILDEALIPSRFFKQPDPVLDKTALNAAVEAGEIVPGTGKSNGGVSLSIRKA